MILVVALLLLEGMKASVESIIPSRKRNNVARKTFMVMHASSSVIRKNNVECALCICWQHPQHHVVVACIVSSCVVLFFVEPMNDVGTSKVASDSGLAKFLFHMELQLFLGLTKFLPETDSRFPSDSSGGLRTLWGVTRSSKIKFVFRTEF